VSTVTTDDGTTLRYAVAGGSDGPGAPVALVGDVGFGAWAWGWQHDALAGPRRVVTFDHRGTGESDAPAGPYDVDRLAADLDSVLGAADARRGHLVGAGLGGSVALRYARDRQPRSLSLLGTAPGDAVDAEALDDCYPADPSDGDALRATLGSLFSAAFREANPELCDRIVDWRRAEDAGPTARRAQAAAARGFEPGPLYELTTPAFVLRGQADPVVDRKAVESLARDLPRGRFESVVGRRLAHAESAPAVNDALLDFFEEVEADD
jgi:pimeloyl-ACP methyl ester carboxylesterase